MNSYKKMLYISSNKKIFVRQGFTESSVEKQQQLQRALDSLVNFQKKGVSLTLLTGNKAESKDTFKTNFEIESGKEFTPHNFRTHRLETMDKADAFVILRTSLSESTVFEVAYNILRGPNIPIFYAIDAAAPLKTTLLRELTGFCGAKVVYKSMDSIENIGEDLDFINFIEHL